MKLVDSLPPAARTSVAPLSHSRVGRPRVRRDWSEWKLRLARLNYILIPDKKTDRDRLRRSAAVRAIGAGFGVFSHFSREGRALCLFAFPVGLASLNVRFSQVHLVFAMLVGLLVGSWLSRPLFRVGRVRAEVRSAPRVAVGAETEIEVEVTNLGAKNVQNLRVVTPFLPWDGVWRGRIDGIAVLEPGRRRRVTARASFRARGEHHLDAFELGVLVPTGLALGPRVASTGARFLVVPKVANVELRFDATAARTQHGANTSVARGEAEIGGVRPYRFGDPLKHLHVRTWARTGEPHVREYLDQRNDRVALVVLVDDPRAREALREAALSVTAGVAAALALRGAGLDTLVIDDQRYPVTPRSGAAALDTVLDRLGTLELRSSRCETNGLLREVLATATSAIVVSAGDTVRLAGVVEDVRRAGLHCPWAVVVDANALLPDSRATRVGLDEVTAGRTIAL